MCTFHSNTNLDCFILRSQINDFLLEHLYSYLSDFIPITISEWTHDNLTDMGRSINELDNPLLLYTKMIRDATPGRCEYGSLLEAFAFAEINNINLDVYQIENNFMYHMITSKHVNTITHTISILYKPEIKHYQALFQKLPQLSNTLNGTTTLK